ncbi:MAG: glucose-1-phosphate adenylyltransferase subunit GlgD [Clostridia bacterium]
MAMACVLFGNSYFQTNNPIAKGRALSSIPYGGRYRNIDFILSSLVEAKVSNIVVTVISDYSSLRDHIGSGKDWDSGFTSTKISNKIEALHNLKKYLEDLTEEYIILSDCNYIMTFDFEEMLEQHIKNEAFITAYYKMDVATEEENISLAVNDEGRITNAKIVKPSKNKIKSLINTFIMSTKDLIEQVDIAISKRWESFELDVVLRNIDKKKVFGFLHEGYSRSIYSVYDFYRANKEILNYEVRKNLFEGEVPIITKVKDSIPTKYGAENKVRNSLIADGCTIDGEVINSVIFRGAKIGKGAKLKDCIIMQNSIIEEGANLTCVICDKNTEVSTGSNLVGQEDYPFYIEKNAKV